MIKGIIFDLDDTLISEKDYIKSGFKVVCNYLSSRYDTSFNNLYAKIFDLFEKNSNYVFNRLLDEFDIEYSKDDILDLVSVYRSHQPDISLYNDAEEILNYLSKEKYKLGIITDGYEITQKKKLESLKIDHYFDCVIITDELGKEYWKPHKKPYQLCSQRLNLKYTELVYIGDNVEKDFITANKLGMKTVQIVREEGVYNDFEDFPEEYQADYKINSLKEIIYLYSL